MEMAQGHGYPITGRLKALGSAPSLGVDLESGISGDMFTVARMAMGMQRAIDNAHSKEAYGKLPDTSTITCKEALEWITIRGAQALKMEDQIGSLRVGKKADVVIIRASDINMCPVHDPISSVIMQTSLHNIDTVIINGEMKKRNGQLLYENLHTGKLKLEESGKRLMKKLRSAAH
jgi:cytosine/adenosine deaminase-related metal-dependent hydrolase